MTKSRTEKKANKAKRISFFRNEMNKAWIGAKKHKNPSNQMKNMAKALLAHHSNEKDTVKAGVAEWYAKHPKVKVWTL